MKDKECEKPGRKTNEKFESEVWGKLMLCIFEKANEDVSAIACIISYKVTSSALMNTLKNENNRTERTYILGHKESCSSGSQCDILLRDNSFRCK